MAGTTAGSMCPMAETCRRMTDRSGSGAWMMAPGVIFIALGTLVIFYPQILAWLVAIALILMGIAMLMMTRFMRRIGR